MSTLYYIPASIAIRRHTLSNVLARVFLLKATCCRLATPLCSTERFLRWRAKVPGLNDAEHKQLCGELPCRSRSAAGGIHSRGGHRTPEYSNMSGGTIYSGGLFPS